MPRVPRNRRIEETRNWQKRLLEDYDAGCVVQIDKNAGEWPGRVETWYAGPEGMLKHSHEGLRPVPVVVVGMDIREYSRRADVDMLFLSLMLHATIEKTLKILRMGGMLEDDEPMIFIWTGDGAHVIFDCGNRGEERHFIPRQTIEKAFAFVLTLNALVWQDNWRNAFREKDEGGGPESAQERSKKVLPMGVRYTMTYGDVLLLVDINRVINCVGNPMVTCRRILGVDHGDHWLIQDRLLDCVCQMGGLARIAEGAWEQRWHMAELPDKCIKEGIFRYADVFGHYMDGPLLRFLGNWGEQPTMYHIGSHDVQVLDRD
jgi:hypothetical protein